MSLCSLDFLVFLFLSATLYYALPKKFQPRILLAASVIFCLSTGVEVFPFVAFAALVTFFFARAINLAACCEKGGTDDVSRRAKREERKRKSRRVLILGLLLLCLPLVALKLASISFSGDFSVLWQGKDRALTMPMGISFYTLQCAGYLIDVHRGKCVAERSFLKFCGFAFFFPQLFLGPISRYSELSHQLNAHHVASFDGIVGGIDRIAWGFFKKLVVADRVMIAVRSLSIAKDYSTFSVLMLIVTYTVAIYADFTGGMDIVLGSAELFGITLRENFKRPFSSTSAREFWNRWHITLGAWFSDYVFYPLSICRPMQRLSKKAKAIFGKGVGRRLPVYIATLFTWLLTGFWHGAAANFLLWGLANAVIILVSQELEPLRRKFRARFPKISEGTAWQGFCKVRTFFIIGVIRLFDVYGSVPATFLSWRGLFLPTRIWSELKLGLEWQDFVVIFAGVCLMLAQSKLAERREKCREDGHDKDRDKDHDKDREKCHGKDQPSPLVQTLKPAALILITMIFGKYGIGFEESSFIYSQF